MNRKGLNFKSVIFKIFFTYLGVYFFALIFKYTYDLESLFNNIQYKYLITLNIVSIFLGLPFSIIFDFILLKIFGFNYVLLFSPALTILSAIQVLILRKIKIKFSRNILFLKKPEKNNLYKFFDNITFRSFYILIIRSFHPASCFGELYYCLVKTQKEGYFNKHIFGIIFLLCFPLSNNR